MSNILAWVWPGSTNQSNEIPEIFPFPYKEKEFISTDVENVYARILTDVLERTQGMNDDQKILLFDNCLASEAQFGLVSLLAKAMTEKDELFLIYDKATQVIRKATADEQAQIKLEYKMPKANQKTGFYITFKNYNKSDFMKLYSGLEYSTVASLSKSMNLSKAIQLKMTDLRASVSLSDKTEAKAQALAMAEGLKTGKDILLDAKDIVETAKPDLTAAQSAMDFVAQKRSFYLGLPASYITGLSSKGLGDSGEGESKAVERGLRGYYFSIIKPVIESIFSIKTTFKSDDFRLLDSSLNALKTFEITDNTLLSQDNKRLIINKLLGLPEDEEGDPEVVKTQVIQTPPTAV